MSSALAAEGCFLLKNPHFSAACTAEAKDKSYQPDVVVNQYTGVTYVFSTARPDQNATSEGSREHCLCECRTNAPLPGIRCRAHVILPQRAPERDDHWDRALCRTRRV